MYQYLFKWDAQQFGSYSPGGSNLSKIWSIPQNHGVKGEPIIGHTPMHISGDVGVNGVAMTPWNTELDTGAASTTQKETMPIVFLRRFRFYNPLLDFYWEMQGGTIPDLNAGLMKFFRGEETGAFSIAMQRGVMFGERAYNGVYSRFKGSEWIDINQFLPSNYTYNKPLASLSKFDVLMLATQGFHLVFPTAHDSLVQDDFNTVCLTRIELEVNTNKLLTSST